MNYANQNLENLLYLIKETAPHSWFPRTYSENTGVPLEAINYFLEELHLDGLIQRGESGNPGSGPGVVLTAKGEEVLKDETKLGRMREGKSLDPNDRGGQVREFLRRSTLTWVTWLLLLLNFLVYGYEIHLANQRGLSRDILGLGMQGGHNLTPLLIDSGAIRGDRIMVGEWWRLLSCCFVHIGLLHLFSNMYVLYREGLYFEKMWGWWRYLLIYLGSGLGGSLLAVAFQPGITTAGASGALCGLLSSAGVWMFLNRKYLPRQIFKRWSGAFIVNVLLITFLSMFPGVSGWGHGGGALFGLILALILNWQRFGPWSAKILGLLAILPVAWVGYQVFERQRATSPAWQELEENHFKSANPSDSVGNGLLLVRHLNEAEKNCAKWSQAFAGMWRRDQARWKDRDPAEVKGLLNEMENLSSQISYLQREFTLAKSRYRQPANVQFIDSAQEIIQSQGEFFSFCLELLVNRDALTDKDREVLKILQKKADEGLKECKTLEKKRLEDLKGTGTP